MYYRTIRCHSSSQSVLQDVESYAGNLRVYPPTATFAGEVRQGFQGISIRDSSLWGRLAFGGVPLDFDDYSKLSYGGTTQRKAQGWLYTTQNPPKN